MPEPAPQGGSFYLDTSAVLRPTLETGSSVEIEERLASAERLVTSRLALVESARAFLRLRLAGSVPTSSIADREREVSSLWQRCEIWEVTPAICELAGHVAPDAGLRALDAIHLATFVTARRRLEGLELLTADERLRRAADR